MLVQKLAAHHDLAAIEAKPLAAHNQVAILAGVLAPAVLDAPSARRAIVCQLDALERHGMRHAALAHVIHRRFVHIQIDIEQALGIDGIEGKHAREVFDVARELLRHVTCHIAGMARFKRSRRSALEDLGRHIQHAHNGSAYHGIHPTHAHHALEGARCARTGNKIDVVIGIKAHITALELLGSDAFLAQDADGLCICGTRRLVRRSRAFLNADFGRVDICMLAHRKLKIEGQRGLAQADAKHAVHILHHLATTLLQFLIRLALLNRSAQNRGIATQQAIEIAIHLRGILGARGLGHDLLGHHAPLLNEVGSKAPLPSIGRGVFQQQGYGAVVKGKMGRGDDISQKGVGLLELVVEHAICLRELEVVHIEQAANLHALRIERREHPTTAGLTLVGHGLRRFDGNAVGIRIRTHGNRVAGCRHHIHRGNGVACNAIATALCELLYEFGIGIRVECRSRGAKQGIARHALCFILTAIHRSSLGFAFDFKHFEGSPFCGSV